jgi:hypothetical protein
LSQILHERQEKIEAGVPEARSPCRGTKKNGEPCRLLAISGGWCFAHSPALAEKRRAAYAAGGSASSVVARLKKLAPSRLGPVTAMLEDVLEGLNSGKKDARTAQAIATVSRALVAVITAGETEDRLRLLEEKFARLDDK